MLVVAGREVGVAAAVVEHVTVGAVVIMMQVDGAEAFVVPLLFGGGGEGMSWVEFLRSVVALPSAPPVVFPLSRSLAPETETDTPPVSLLTPDPLDSITSPLGHYDKNKTQTISYIIHPFLNQVLISYCI